MDCQHTNPSGFAFCATCGGPLPHQRCVCGFLCDRTAQFCGRCGTSLAAPERGAGPAGAGPAAVEPHKLNLGLFAGIKAVESKQKPQAVKKKLTQAEIRELLKKKAVKA